MKKYLGSSARIDHIAVAVTNLDEALFLYQDVFGFNLLAEREVKGAFSGMKSAELDAGTFSIVLMQGTDSNSQICRYIEEYGPGVQHIAIKVDDVEKLSKFLTDSGVKFATDIIHGSDLVQIFTQRDINTGMMFEFIQRVANTNGFETGNIQKLFRQLEANDAY